MLREAWSETRSHVSVPFGLVRSATSRRTVVASGTADPASAPDRSPIRRGLAVVPHRPVPDDVRPGSHLLLPGERQRQFDIHGI